MGRNALIIGGSMGGLFAAHLLRSIGWTVQVFERNVEDLSARGAGLGSHPELESVMERIGLSIDSSRGLRMRSRVFLGHSGKIISERPSTELKTSWSTLYQTLLAALPADLYRQGMSATGLRFSENEVTVAFSDGTEATGDLVVAADGIRSTLRTLLIPDVEPVYAGYLAWRGIIKEEGVRLYDEYAFSSPAGELTVTYPVPGREGEVDPGKREINFAWYRRSSIENLMDMATDVQGRRHGLSIAPNAIRRDVIARFRQDASELLAPQLAELVAAIDQPFFQGIMDLECPKIVHEKVAFIGDAAFTARPHVGAGVTKAALDAACLCDNLAAHSNDLREALRGFELDRLRFGHRLVQRGRCLGAFLQEPCRAPASESDLRGFGEEILREHAAPLSKIPELVS